MSYLNGPLSEQSYRSLSDINNELDRIIVDLNNMNFGAAKTVADMLTRKIDRMIRYDYEVVYCPGEDNHE